MPPKMFRKLDKINQKMSTLVSILLSLVLNMLSVGTLQENAKDVSHRTEKVQTTNDIENLRPQYLISKDELALTIWEEQLK